MEQRKLAKNAFALLINRLIQSITAFILTATIARTLGAYELGQYVLAFSYYFIFVSISSQGLKTLFTREMSLNPKDIPVYLVSGTVLQLFLSIIGYIAMIIVVFILPYSLDTSIVCYIMGLTIIPFSLSNITEAIFQAQERMNLIAISTVPVYVIRLLVMIWCMQLNYGVNHIAGIFLISETLIFVIEWIMITKIVKPQWQIKQDFVWQLLKSARTFLAIDAVGIITTKMDILMISLLGSELLVGIYGAIIQLMQPFTMIVNSLCLAAFPRITKAVNLGKQAQRQVTENIIEVLLCIALPFVVGLLFIGSDLLTFVYKDSNFSEATLALQISSLSLITYPFVRTLVYLLLSNGFEKINLIEAVTTMTIGGLSGIVLISNYQLMGAALMDVVISLTAFSIFMYAVYDRLFSLQLGKIIRRPILISIGMICVFLILQKFSFNFLLVLIMSTLAYVLFATALTVHTLGGIQVAWGKLFSKT